MPSLLELPQPTETVAAAALSLAAAALCALTMSSSAKKRNAEEAQLEAPPAAAALAAASAAQLKAELARREEQAASSAKSTPTRPKVGCGVIILSPDHPGCVLLGKRIGKNGGGLNHYVGQEKLAPAAPCGAIAFAKDWHGPPRLQNAPSWHYMHSDQWRYEGEFTEYHTVPGHTKLAKGHTADMNVRAVKSGWLPFFPQFNESSIEFEVKW